MPGVAVKGRDRAGGVQLEQAHDWFVLETNETEPGDPIVTVGDRVAPHDSEAPHNSAPVMVEGESWFPVDETPVSRAEHAASCGHRTTGRYWFQLESEEDGFRPYRTNPSDLCNIEHIPWIMRAQGWHVGAKLMDNWFERPASRNASQAQDYTTVTMDFILGFEDVRAKYEDMTNTARWSLPVDGFGDITTEGRICIRLKEDGYLTTVPTAFDYLSMRPHELKQMGLQVDGLEIRKGLPPFDDLGAALGEFELFLAVAGDVEPLSDDRFRVTIRRMGVFVEDSYDFEGIGSIGFKRFPFGDWNPETHEVKLPFTGDGCVADDADFNRWRDATIAEKDGRGGDIMIYTEWLIEELDPPYQFVCRG
ncbi:MAG: DUF6402 family protein [Rhodospirillales bacterium]|nr:DUF6402 family protein [Rhodospirillales bacterium]